MKLKMQGYKFRIYPNEEQQEMFEKHFGCTRFVYNFGLALKQEYYEKEGKSLSKRQVQDALVALKKDPEHLWLNEVNSQSLLASLGNLDVAYNNFFKGLAKFPKFKSKYKSKKRFQCPQHVTVDFAASVINLPKIKNVKIKMHRAFEGKIKTCTVEKCPNGHYYVSILVDNQRQEVKKALVEEEFTLGLDFGVTDLIITSDGKKYSNPKFIYEHESKIKKLSRRLAKKEKKSKNRNKARNLLAKEHAKLKRKRLDLLHKITSDIVYKSQETSIAIEDLNVKGMMKNHCLAKAIGNCGFGIMERLLAYKCDWAGKNLLKIDRFAPSSKTCSHCGHKKEKLELSTRTYVCENCDTSIDRDINAAINIKNFALAKEIGGGTSEVKLVDHALPGHGLSVLGNHGLKQEALPRT